MREREGKKKRRIKTTTEFDYFRYLAEISRFWVYMYISGAPRILSYVSVLAVDGNKPFFIILYTEFIIFYPNNNMLVYYACVCVQIDRQAGTYRTQHARVMYIFIYVYIFYVYFFFLSFFFFLLRYQLKKKNTHTRLHVYTYIILYGYLVSSRRRRRGARVTGDFSFLTMCGARAGYRPNAYVRASPRRRRSPVVPSSYRLIVSVRRV